MRSLRVQHDYVAWQIFQPLYSSAPFRDDMVLMLRGREDRAEYNLPRMLRDLRAIGNRSAFLPGYVIETADSGLLVYTPLAPERDAFYEKVAGQAPVLAQLISTEQGPGPQQIWTGWLAEGHGPGTFSQLPTGYGGPPCEPTHPARTPDCR